MFLDSDIGDAGGAAYGGRVRTPAPAAYRETRLSLRRGRSQTGPRAHTVRPYGMAWAARPGGRALRAVWSTEGGHMGPPLRLKRTALITRGVPLIRHASRDTFP